MITEDVKIQVRRFLGYPVAGPASISSPSGGLAGGFNSYYFFRQASQLEHRLDFMSALEISVLTGKPGAEIRLTSAQQYLASLPSGKVLTIRIQATIGEDDLDETVSFTTAGGESLDSVAVDLMNGLNADSALVQASFQALAPVNAGVFSQQPSVAISAQARPPYTYSTIQIISDYQFQVAVTAQSPIVLMVNGPALARKPQPTSVIEDVELNGYLPILGAIESALGQVSENLDTSRADVWYARADELPARKELFNYWRLQLASFLGIPMAEMVGANPGRRSGSGMMVA